MVVFIQCRIRYLLFRKNQLNKKLDILYNLFNEIMANIQFLHLYDVITHTVYNLSMNAVNIIFTYFKKLPRPLRLNTCSVTTRPPMKKENSIPMIVTTGRNAFFNACRFRINFSFKPFARAVRM